MTFKHPSEDVKSNRIELKKKNVSNKTTLFMDLLHVSLTKRSQKK
jgi:hypothetical protein